MENLKFKIGGKSPQKAAPRMNVLTAIRKDLGNGEGKVNLIMECPACKCVITHQGYIGSYPTSMDVRKAIEKADVPCPECIKVLRYAKPVGKIDPIVGVTKIWEGTDFEETLGVRLLNLGYGGYKFYGVSVGEFRRFFDQKEEAEESARRLCDEKLLERVKNNIVEQIKTADIEDILKIADILSIRW